MTAHKNPCGFCDGGVYCATGARREARNAAALTPGNVHDTADAAVGAVLGRLLELFGGAVNCDPRDDLDRGHDEALRWVCSELELLKGAQ